jgi:hypothetical protein
MYQQLNGVRDLVFNELHLAKSVDKYADYMRFPFDADDDDSMRKVLSDAGRREPKAWKKKFIGEQMKPTAFCSQLEELIKQR